MSPDPLDATARDLALTAEDHATEPAADLRAPEPTANGEASADAPPAAVPVPAPSETTAEPSSAPAAEPAPEPPAPLDAPAVAVSSTITVTRTEHVEPAPPAAVPAAAVPVAVATTSLPLEERVSRLEEALAHLQEMRGMKRTPEPITATAATPVPQAPSERRGPAEGSRPVSYPAAAVAAMTKGARRRWPLFDAWTEARAIVRMFVDPRYSLPWSSRLLALVLLAAFVTSKFWLPLTSLPIAGTLFDKTVDLVLGFALFKVLGHEARRYRESAPDLPPSLRL
jgi:hypothetical protein